MLASPTERTSTRLPRWRGVRPSSSMLRVTRARARSSRAMSLIEPTVTPPTFTWSPRTSWLALTNVAWTVYEPPAPHRRNATITAASPIATTVIRRTATWDRLPIGTTDSSRGPSARGAKVTKSALRRAGRPAWRRGRLGGGGEPADAPVGATGRGELAHHPRQHGQERR